MGFLLISIFAIFSLGLLNFIERTDWEELDEKNAARLSSNRAYGVYNLRTTQPFTLLYIVLGFVAVLIIYFLGHAVATAGEDLNMDNMEQKSSQYVDTTQFAMSMDNQTEDLPNTFNQAGNNGDNMPQAQKGAPEKSDDQSEKFTKNNDSPKPEKQKKMTQEEYQKALEQSYFDEFKGNEEKRKKQIEENEKRKKEWEEKNKSKQKQVNGGNGGVAGSSSSNKGNVSVYYKFNDNRTSFEHNDDKYVPAPAYTCGNEVDAEVKIKVKVDANGYVKNATVISSSLENGCIKQNAIAYAYKSRFNPAQLEMQDGTITYRYKAK